MPAAGVRAAEDSIMTPAERQARAIGWAVWPGALDREEAELEDEPLIWVEVGPPPGQRETLETAGSLWARTLRRLLTDIRKGYVRREQASAKRRRAGLRLSRRRRYVRRERPPA